MRRKDAPACMAARNNCKTRQPDLCPCSHDWSRMMVGQEIRPAAREAFVGIPKCRCVIFVMTVGVAAVGAAQQPSSVLRPYDGTQAGLDAFRLAEEKRQAGVAQQLFLNDQMRFWNGYPTSRGETIYYGYLSPAAMAAYGFAGPSSGYANGTPLLTRANLDYAYAYGAGPLWGGYRQGWFGPLSVLQPWPYVPGDIYGYPANYQP